MKGLKFIALVCFFHFSFSSIQSKSELSSNGGSTADQVDVLYFDSKNVDVFLDTFNGDYVKRKLPVIVKGLANEWPLMDKWNVDFLADAFGHQVGRIANDGRPKRSHDTRPLREYFSKRHDEDILGVFSPDVMSRYREEAWILKDIELPNPLFDESNITKLHFFHGKKTGGCLPHKGIEYFDVLQSGVKRWAIWDETSSGDETQKHFNLLYPQNATSSEWFEREFDSLPSKVGCNVYEALQEPGDIMYVPDGFVRAYEYNDEETMGVVLGVGGFKPLKSGNAFKVPNMGNKKMEL